MKQKPHKILFVCLGNICRSPAAEAVMQQLVDRAGLHDNFVIDSAGTYGGHAGEPADRRMRQAASKRGYALTSRSRKITPDDFETFDRIVVMDDSTALPRRWKPQRKSTGWWPSAAVPTPPTFQTLITKGTRGSNWYSICSKMPVKACWKIW